MNRKIVYGIVLSGLLIALSIVLTRVFSADLLIAGVPASRLSIGFVPIILAGIMLGPGWGAAVGAIADVLGFFLLAKGVYFFPITVTSALAGVLPWLIYHFLSKAAEWLKVLFCVSSVQILCSMLLQTYWLTLLYGKAFGVLLLPRAIVALATIPIYYIFIHSLLLGLKKARLFPKQLA
jgi:riboflavin transporter